MHVKAATAAGITIAIVIVVTALALWGIWWLWWRFPKRQMRSVTASNPKERADIEDNFRKTIGQVLGGAAVLIGAGFARFQFLQQQKDAQDRSCHAEQPNQAFAVGGRRPCSIRSTRISTRVRRVTVSERAEFEIIMAAAVAAVLASLIT